MSTISSIGTAVPPFRYTQSELLEFMKSLYQVDEDEARKLALLYKKSGINTRYSVLEDYKLSIEDRHFFPKTRNLEPFPTLEKRMDHYWQHAPNLAQEAILNCLGNHTTIAEITHLITVSCTGLAAPGLDIMLVQQLGFEPTIERTSINFMGCYAALHGLKMADHIIQSNKKAKVLVVCVELCTLHFQKDQDMDNIMANLLFADGAAAALLTDKKTGTIGLEARSFYSAIELKGKAEMAWHLSSKGFLMTLSAYIPDLIQLGFRNLVEKALQKAQVPIQDINLWAIHPGGRKILDVIANEFSISQHQIGSSYRTLTDYGNMSSATILFVLQDLLATKPTADQNIFGAAFGPGLTMETFVLRVV